METNQFDTSRVAEVINSVPNFENLSSPIQIALFMSAFMFLSAFLVSVTSFTRIVIVLSFVRRALTTQEIPPNSTIIGLALFMTYFTMGPVIDAIHQKSISPYLQKEDPITATLALRNASQEIRQFMLSQTRQKDLALFVGLSGEEPPSRSIDSPLRILVPAFMVSELKTAFIMGFCIYIPFILVDLLVSTILMSLGMMMMPPVVVSAPVKLLLFVLVDGWHLIAQALGASFT